jgi:hypothetical protein
LSIEFSGRYPLVGGTLRSCARHDPSEILVLAGYNLKPQGPSGSSNAERFSLANAD